MNNQHSQLAAPSYSAQSVEQQCNQGEWNYANARARITAEQELWNLALKLFSESAKKGKFDT